MGYGAFVAAEVSKEAVKSVTSTGTALGGGAAGGPLGIGEVVGKFASLMETVVNSRWSVRDALKDLSQQVLPSLATRRLRLRSLGGVLEAWAATGQLRRRAPPDDPRHLS
jgi:hypothetical protein